MPDPDHEMTPARLTWLEVAGVVLAVVVLIAFRLHAFDLPLETDECNYAYIGKRLLEGDRLYVDVWDHQPFGVFALFALAIGLFGDAPLVFRWMATGFSVASLLLIYAIARLAAGRLAAFGATVLFAIVSADPGTGGEGANREIYMNTLILAGWYCGLRWAAGPRGQGEAPQDVGENPRERSRRPRQSGRTPSAARWSWLFSAGLCLGLASCIKTIVAIQWLALAVWAAYAAARPSGRARPMFRAVLAVVVIGAGPALLWLGAFCYFAGTGRAEAFIDAVFRFNVSYSEGGQGFFERFALFFRPPRHPFIFHSAMPLWIAAVVAVVVLAFRSFREKHREARLILALVLSSYAAVCMPARFWPHYYYLLVPPAVVTVATTIAHVAELLRSHAAKNRSGSGVAVLLFAVVAPGVGLTEYQHYLSQPPFGITVNRYNSRDFWGRAQGENVARVTKPGDRVFVYGNEAEIYYYSGRRCASRYTMITGLAEGMSGAAERREVLMQELRADPPRLILVVFDQEPFEDWRAFLDEFYGEPIGWDYHDRTRKAIMFALARKDRPVEVIDWNWDRSSVGGWHAGTETLKR